MFKLTQNGVLRLADDVHIPDDSENRDWQEYQVWLGEGNTPDPEYTQEELDGMAIDAEISDLKASLQRTQVWLFRMILEVWEVGKNKGLWDNTDITDLELKQKTADWKTKLDRLAELGE